MHRTQGQKQRYETDVRAYTNKCLAFKESTKPNENINTKRQKVPDDEDIDINKIVQGDRPRGGIYTADITAKQQKDKEAKRLVPEKVKRIQRQNGSKNTEENRHMIEKAQIEALIEKHRLCTPKTPDQVNKLGTDKNATEKKQEGAKKGKPSYKKATEDIQIKKSRKKEIEATNAKTGKEDTLLGDLVAKTTTGIEKEKGKGQKDKISIDDIGIFEFVFKGLPEPPELEGIDEDRLRDLQNAIQEQLRKRDEERERNITKRVQEFEKTMFLQRYNPQGITKREQLQSWNILSFNPKTTDVDEHIDLINTLGDMVDQKEEAKKEKFIETMPTRIQTHLITYKNKEINGLL